MVPVLNLAIIRLSVPAEIVAPFCCCMQRTLRRSPRRRKNIAGRKVFRRIADPQPRPYTPVAPFQERAPRTGVLEFGAMPFPISSSIAFLFLGRCDSSMPRSPFGALVNWMFWLLTIPPRSSSRLGGASRTVRTSSQSGIRNRTRRHFRQARRGSSWWSNSAVPADRSTPSPRSKSMLATMMATRRT